MLGVKDPGRVLMAWDIRPGFRGDLVLCDDGQLLKLEARSHTNQDRNLQGSAQSRVLRAA